MKTFSINHKEPVKNQICLISFRKVITGLAFTIISFYSASSLADGVNPRSIYKSTSCNSSGQICDRAVDVEFKINNEFRSVFVKAPQGHCTNISYTVVMAGAGRVGRTSFLRAGQSKKFPIYINSSPRTAKFRVYARGTRGGCNHGRLSSWGVIVGLNSN